jgi:hypothetical protein
MRMQFQSDGGVLAYACIMLLVASLHACSGIYCVKKLIADASKRSLQMQVSNKVYVMTGNSQTCKHASVMSTYITYVHRRNTSVITPTKDKYKQNNRR